MSKYREYNGIVISGSYKSSSSEVENSTYDKNNDTSDEELSICDEKSEILESSSLLEYSESECDEDNGDNGKEKENEMDRQVIFLIPILITMNHMNLRKSLMIFSIGWCH
jgi:hypothetical protein